MAHSRELFQLLLLKKLKKMLNKYRNSKTGVIIEIPSKLTDKDWELVAPDSAVKETPKKSVKKTKRS